MHKALEAQDLLDFDCLIPIPLSPDKAALGELHRTKELARELGALSGIPVVEALSLQESISKRRLMASGWGPRYFASKYLEALEVVRRVSRFRRVLLIDDVCTRGTTLSVAFRRLMMENPELEVAAATAGQMVLKPVVKNEDAVLAS
jgi:predicted amidophosphoribosyltransferase